jgi:hypothetical protein
MRIFHELMKIGCRRSNVEGVKGLRAQSTYSMLEKWREKPI